ncbi:DUF3168 domain-containing protein [Nioella sp.]|uniref:tail completion protein gp17 n=1 Tax=Nioella sp. TaxID=1912091 RepID=UPI0035186668
MSFETELRALLTGSAAVTALVPAARINWSEHPQGAPAPYVVLHLIDNADGLHLKGRTGLWSGRVQVDCYAATPAGAIALSAPIVTLLHGYVGGGFNPIRFASMRGPFVQQRTGQDDRLFARQLDFITHWRGT